MLLTVHTNQQLTCLCLIELGFLLLIALWSLVFLDLCDIIRKHLAMLGGADLTRQGFQYLLIIFFTKSVSLQLQAGTNDLLASDMSS